MRARRSHGFSSKSQWRGRLHDVQVPFNAYHHVALNFLTLLRDDPMDPIDSAPIEGDAALPLLRAPEGAWEACCARLSADPAWRASVPIVVINPNAGDMALERRWPAARVAELLGLLAMRADLNLVAIGAQAEREYVQSVTGAARLEARVVNAAGRLDIPQLVALLSRASVVVSNDSGPLHLAAAAGARRWRSLAPRPRPLWSPALTPGPAPQRPLPRACLLTLHVRARQQGPLVLVRAGALHGRHTAPRRACFDRTGPRRGHGRSCSQGPQRVIAS